MSSFLRKIKHRRTIYLILFGNSVNRFPSYETRYWCHIYVTITIIYNYSKSHKKRKSISKSVVVTVLGTSNPVYHWFPVTSQYYLLLSGRFNGVWSLVQISQYFILRFMIIWTKILSFLTRNSPKMGYSERWNFTISSRIFWSLQYDSSGEWRIPYLFILIFSFTWNVPIN